MCLDASRIQTMCWSTLARGTTLRRWVISVCSGRHCPAAAAALASLRARLTSSARVSASTPADDQRRQSVLQHKDARAEAKPGRTRAYDSEEEREPAGRRRVPPAKAFDARPGSSKAAATRAHKVMRRRWQSIAIYLASFVVSYSPLQQSA